MLRPAVVLGDILRKYVYHRLVSGDARRRCLFDNNAYQYMTCETDHDVITCLEHDSKDVREARSMDGSVYHWHGEALQVMKIRRASM